MTSKQAGAVLRHWQQARLAMELPEDERPDVESWGDLTAEPRQVDYLEIKAGGRPAIWAVPHAADKDRVLLCIHGGGFIGGSIYSHRKLFGHLAKATGTRALIFDYRLVPAHRHPAQVDDVTDVYAWLLDQGVAADRVTFAGDSCGGGLAITAQLRARERGLPLPAASVLISPWVDMEVTGASYDDNRDAFFTRDLVRGLAEGFLGPDGDPRDPLASPLHADLTGIGPLAIQVGGDEALLDDALLLERHAKRAGVQARLEVFPEMQHTFQMGAGRVPEADAAIRSLAGWLRA